MPCDVGEEPCHRRQEYESAAARAPTTVAAFESTHDRALVGASSTGCTQTPSLVPLIVLVGSISSSAALGQKFFSPFALTLILQQVQIVGILAAAQSLVILTAGIDLSVGAIGAFLGGHGPVHIPLRPPAEMPWLRPRLRHIRGSTAFSSP
jgi:hypothetical protein